MKPATSFDPRIVQASRLVGILGSAAEIVRPPPLRDAGAWADEKRILPPGSPEPGPWRTSRVPFMRPVYAAFMDPRYDSIIVAIASQMSKTESIFNILGHRFDEGPRVPALYVGPTQKQVTSISTDRFYKMLQSTPSLWEKLEKGQRDKTTEKFIAGVRLGFAWAGSATELASHPAGIVIVDERDRMDADVGAEGDPFELARARVKNYFGGKAGAFSSPTIEGASAIWSLFEEGTMMKWAWPCPHCSILFIPRLELLRWPEGADAGEAKLGARLVCPGCGGEIENHCKHDMLERGQYLPHVLDQETGDHIRVDEPRDLPTASFWVSGLCSPWESWGAIAAKLVNAYRSREQERIQAVINTSLGEIFRVKGERPEWTAVAECRRPYRPPTPPRGVQLITAGVDVQKRGLYWVVRGWAYMMESYLLGYGYLAGATDYDEVWIRLSHILNGSFGDKRIDRMFVDSGYRPGMKDRRPENSIYMFCRRHHGLAFPTKGHDKLDAPLKASDIDVDVGGARIKHGLTLWHLDSDYFKSWIHSRVRWPQGEAGGWYLHAETDEDFCRQIVSEEVIVKPSGRRVWIVRNRDNHYLDAEAEATAAAYSLAAHTLAPLPEPPKPGEPAKTTAPAAEGRQSFITRRPGERWDKR